MTINPNILAHLGGHENMTIMDEETLDYLVKRYNIKSMLDVGCGPGGMIDYAKSIGLEAAGVDGDPTLAREDIAIHDFVMGPYLTKNYDLIWSVEFVEHVDEEYIDNFLATFLLGNVLFVTHAQPMQGGHHHVNLKDDDYWKEKLSPPWVFDAEATTWIRERSKVDPYIKKSALVFTKPDNFNKANIIDGRIMADIKTTKFLPTLINEKYTVVLPDFLNISDIWGSWEKERIESIRENMKLGDTFFDIGSENGSMSALFAQFVGGENMVLFEPSPTFWPDIKAIWEHNDLKTPKYTFLGFVGDETANIDKPFEGQIRDGWPEAAYDPELCVVISYRYLWEPMHKKEAQSYKLDDFYANKGIYPQGMAIDVEGAELLILKGAENILTKFKPKVWMSVHADLAQNHYNVQEGAEVKYLESLGYTCTHLATDHEQHWFCEVK